VPAATLRSWDALGVQLVGATVVVGATEVVEDGPVLVVGGTVGVDAVVVVVLSSSAAAAEVVGAVASVGASLQAGSNSSSANKLITTAPRPVAGG